MDRTKTKRLIALLHAQRMEAAIRSALLRGSSEWARSSARLNALNDEIMRVAAIETAPRRPFRVPERAASGGAIRRR
jgi:hypothetical protein